jgi:hypothetical protein
MNDNTQYNFKTICVKEKMHLKREKNNNIYLLQFLAENNNVNLYTMINLDIYNLMFTLNKDNFEKIEMHGIVSTTLSCGSGSGSENKNVNEVNVLFLFKPFASDLGIKPKYMYVRVTEVCEPNKKTYNCVDIDYPNPEELKNYDKVVNTISSMVVNFESYHKINISYIFKLDLSHSLPIYMENIMGLIMKKVFLNLKQFIELIH